MTVLFWDIDGTLLTTARGGMFAWDDGVKEITGRDFQLASLRVPGLTDYLIAARTCELLGLEPSPPIFDQLANLSRLRNHRKAPEPAPAVGEAHSKQVDWRRAPGARASAPATSRAAETAALRTPGTGAAHPGGRPERG